MYRVCYFSRSLTGRMALITVTTPSEDVALDLAFSLSTARAVSNVRVWHPSGRTERFTLTRR